MVLMNKALLRLHTWMPKSSARTVALCFKKWKMDLSQNEGTTFSTRENDDASWGFMDFVFRISISPKMPKRQVHRKKTGFCPFPLVHSPINSCLWCYQHAASVLCRAAGDFLGKHWETNYSYISQMHALQLSLDENVPTNNVNFCIPGAYDNNLIGVFAKIISRWASDSFSH